MKQIVILFALLFLLACIFINECVAQDVLVLKTGDEIKCSVVEQTRWEVIYLKENTKAPSYSTMKSEVFMIKYADGRKDMFNATQAHTEANYNTSVQTPLPQPTAPKLQTNHYSEKVNTGYISANFGVSVPGTDLIKI